MAKKSRQEEAFEYVTKTFVKLIQRDKRIEHKKEALAFFDDFFTHEGIRNNMVQAFSNFLFEIDEKMEANRKAGLIELRNLYTLNLESNGYEIINLGAKDQTIKYQRPLNGEIDMWLIFSLIEELLKPAEEETIARDSVAKMDLTEVGGGDEDDTPLM